MSCTSQRGDTHFDLGTHANVFTVNLHVLVKGTSRSLTVRASALAISDCALGFWTTEQDSNFTTHSLRSEHWALLGKFPIFNKQWPFVSELRGKEDMMKDGRERGQCFEVQAPEPRGLPRPHHTPLTQTGSSH